jgi:hypothetical protein
MAQGSIRGAGAFRRQRMFEKVTAIAAPVCSERPALSSRLDSMTDRRFNAAERQPVDATTPARSASPVASRSEASRVKRSGYFSFPRSFATIAGVALGGATLPQLVRT